jgi:1-acyl-sn-glycerol-3-phosphate acyltransferase
LNLFKNIFARFWAVWGLLSFVVTFLLFFIPSMCSHLFKDEKKGQAFFIQVSKIWMKVWMFLIGCRVEIYGEENMILGENYIVVFNHQSLMDIPLSAPFVPGVPNKTIGKSSFAKVPIFGWFYARGAILVDRKNEISRRKSYEDMKNVLQQGMHMCIYPEGTRNRTSEPLKSFYDGAFKLSVDSHKPVLPCIIRGTEKALPVHRTFYLLPATLSMTFLNPVHPENLSVGELKEFVFDEMKRELLK